MSSDLSGGKTTDQLADIKRRREEAKEIVGKPGARHYRRPDFTLADIDFLLVRLAEAERLQVRAEDRSHDQFMARKAAEAERDRLKAALEQIAAGAQSWHGPEPPHSGHVRALAVIAEVARAALAADEEGPESDEMVCDRCGRRHGVVWFAPSDVWNAVMRGGDRGNPDEFPFCCPICFIQLAEERGIRPTGWCVAPEALAADEEGDTPHEV